ncbi:aldo keto reductase [Lactobacillus pasteurii DSM 23907 = CRBIP 24.76]|uniref:Morphine 6-dehydrogenase n=1 Tax=Lactobacillus pasteurii DSM 23907 = CRBIP 24.76 TaxID=1423790 RepID=I7JYF5_9LACO|nr:aldo/keto reductase [Lactobacillus pasteurii]KRK07741.1 aldo keto reductase [Lactobacillus pasteurii DSM 23907 = CRBIP 24.76]TDG77538.1 hypothetical protein C5L33_000981 [Lactobacillus pasteurii]CCI85500.1 Morphine 6-dehydrogenase [Lactobacillus pasteurii DSM 23907 = CRBIP 24.76]
MYDKTITLTNGVVVPQLALGTWLIDNDHVAKAVLTALDLGYRHIDTAQAYGNESGIGQALKETSLKRQDYFITTKVAAENKTYESAAKSIDESLAKLGLDYIDLMIIHSPQPWKEVNQSDNRYFEENKEVWRAMEDAYKAGKLRAIGVSNFLAEDLDNILADCEIKPTVNQILCHISNTPLDLIDYCQKHDIALEAYSPVAHGANLDNPVIVKTAQKYGVSVPQLCIKYDLQLGMITLPKTANPDHMKANGELDFEISDEDMEILKHVEKIKDYGEGRIFPVYGGKL